MVESDRRNNNAGNESVWTEGIANFVINLIQAFLRTGYYLPEHPESQKAKSGLYELFALLTRDSGEISFLLNDEQGHKVISIEGFSDEPIRLARIMPRGMRDTYNPRFVQYLERKELLSLSLKSGMGEEEFSSFIDLMSEPNLSVMKGRIAKEKFEAGLKRKGIREISFVFNEDFILLRPGIPWRTGLALSRLRKDLRMAPIFRNAAPDELHLVRKGVLRDIVRPINDPFVLYSFLMNLDLAESSELSEEDGENELFAAIRSSLISSLAENLLQDASGARPRFRDMVTSQKMSRVAQKISASLLATSDQESKPWLREMFRQGLIPLHSLPPGERDRILTESFAAKFLVRRDENLHRIHISADPHGYASQVKALPKVIVYLLEEAKYEDAVAIADALATHAAERSPRGGIARQAMAWITGRPSLHVAAGAFMHAPKQDRILLGRFFLLLGPEGAPHLLPVLRESSDLWRCKQLAECIVQTGPDGPSALVRELRQNLLTSEAAIAIIRILRESDAESVLNELPAIIRKTISGKNGEIRRECLYTLYKLAPRESFDEFKELLQDEDLKTRKIALKGLGICGDQRAFGLLSEVVINAETRGTESDWEMAAYAIEALGDLFEASPEAGEAVVRFLLGLAERAQGRAKWQRLVSRAPAFPPESVLVMAQTLIPIRRKEGLRLLDTIVNHRDRHVSGKALKLLHGYRL